MCEISPSHPRRVKHKNHVADSQSKALPETGARTGSDHLASYSPRDSYLDQRKAEADAIAAIYGRGGEEWERYAARVGACAGLLSFAWTAPDQSTGESRLKLVGAAFCKVRTCSMCQQRRALMHKARFLNRLPSITSQHPKARWLFLTLTIKNCDLGELRPTVKEMNRSFAKLVKWKRWPALGWIKSIEVTRANDRSAHPHFHCMLLVPSSYFGRDYIKQAEWTEMWRDAMKLDYQPVIDVRAVKRGGETDTAAETLKYSVKPADLVQDDEWLLEYTRQVKGMRFVDTGGVLRGILADDYDDLINADEEPSGDALDADEKALVFGWDRPIKRYRKHKPS
jgi:plasmid rolling circle replication initiator protein Rep